VDGVSLGVAAGALVVVVGPNGAGKSTLINAIAGVHPAQSGEIVVAGESLRGLAPHRFCERGVALVPEGRRLFTTLSVRENLELGAYLRRARRAQLLDEVLSFFPALQAKLRSPAGTLSGGQQQMVALGRALMAEPKVLLLDEPSLGLAPAIVAELFRLVRAIHARGVAVLLVEQNAAAALDIASYAYVLEEGRVVAQGAAGELAGEPRIRRAYLGLN
jgi:branched-chain amino acid transport system ATP-binding protein